MTESPPLRAVLRAYLADRASSWSVGGHGAIAEFHWLPDDDPRVEPDHDPEDPGEADSRSLRVLTAAGGLRIDVREDIVPHAYQALSRHPQRWRQGMTLCLPWRRAQRGARRLLTELGRDREALRRRDRRAVLFDLGLGLPHVDACVRSDSAPLLATLRAASGRSLLEPGNPVMAALIEASPHRVFISALGRLEVYQGIPPAEHAARTPPGPHTHVLPRLLARRRGGAGHGDTPAYHRACACLYPPPPVADPLAGHKAYDGEAHARFTALMERWGDPHYLAERQRAMGAMRAGVDARRYRAPTDAKGRRALRIAIRELAQQRDTSTDSGLIDDWRRRFDAAKARSR